MSIPIQSGSRGLPPPPLTVLLIGPSIERTQGGMATVLHDLLTADLPGVRFRHLVSHVEGAAREKLAYAGRALLAFGRAEAFDVVHIHVASGASFYRKSLFVLAARLRRKPVVMHVHGADFDEFYLRSPAPLRLYIRRIFALCARILVLSDSWRAFFEEHITRHGVAVHHNGVKVGQAAVEAPAAQAGRFLFLGRLGARKGIYDLLAAVASLAKEQPAPNMHFLLAGDGEIAEVQQEIAAQQLQSQVTVLGWVGAEARPGLFGQVACLVLPSYNEGLPMAILEAMAAGKVIISTRVGGIPDLVENNVNGFLLEPGDVPGLARCLRQVTTNPELVARMAANNLAKIEKSYNLTTLNQQLAELYRTLASEASGTV